jgi:acyl dehydratase
VAKANSFDRPILHGLCTLGIAARLVAEAVDAHPCELVSLSARLAAPVMPGDQIDILASPDGNSVNFEARVGETGVLKAGQAVFG